MHAIVELAEFIARHPENVLPRDTRDTISLLVLDLIGATAAGLNSPLAQTAREGGLAVFGEGSVDVWLTSQKSSIIGAAMANGAAASALDIDDGHRGAAGHAGAGVIPAALAVAQAVGASDARIADAIALGYEVALRVASARPVPTIITYASGRWVGYGVAAAASRLLGLNGAQTAHALAIAGAESPGMFASGTSKYQGSTVKEGIPAAIVAGLAAVYRARAGGTGPLDLLDDAQLYDRSMLTGDLGDAWALQQCYLKPYACCRYMHAAVDAILELRKPGRDIRSLRIETFPQALRLANERAPRFLEGGQYSFYFSCALAALRGREALQPVLPESLHDAQVLDLAARIELEVSEDFAGSFPAGTPARVIFDQGEGRQEMVVWHPLGDVANPMSREQVAQKFRNIARHTLPPSWQDEILAATDGLETAGFAPLFQALIQPEVQSSKGRTVECHI
ncbi:MmgE/PrpD family protein [Falsochrobactrum shanghaiense]|uniref:MmgE/PrpD family protein n=1 Tax=Falsochrobactrum shanghaiense TaxID=2201899 RepID=A0A316JBS5_9HYPH|nr:MmgE/PrpD family protein [Falsochrobactrum shanghaiense]PWL18904.1 MmgE/PrpD family protein [Falsochrobactrum shanghaiense]